MKKTKPATPARDAIRPTKIRRNVSAYAEGSALIEMGNTHVLCTASVEAGVPRFRADSGGGWLTAEYGMLPRSTHTRSGREATRGKQGGRTVEISRLIGRSLRAAVDLDALGAYTLTIDCDVLQADGGTRCASITGGMVALYDAIRWMRKHTELRVDPIRHFIAAVSVGIVGGALTLDLCYAEDSTAEVDMNVVMTGDGRFIEVQGTAEREPFSERDFTRMRKLAAKGVADLIALQRKTLRVSG